MTAGKIVWILASVFIVLGVVEFIFIFQKYSDMVEISNQPMGETLEVNGARLYKPGFVVVKKKNPPTIEEARVVTVFQSDLLQKGIYTDINIKVPYDLENKIEGLSLMPGDNLIVTIYTDNGNGTFSPIEDREVKTFFGGSVGKEIVLGSSK